MASPQRSYFTFAAGSVSIVSTTETVVGTTRAVSSAYPGCGFLIKFGCQFTAGSTQTSVVAKIEEGTAAAGTAIYTSGALTVANSGLYVFTFAATDAIAGDVAAQQWVLTLTQAGGVTNGAAANVWSEVVVAL